MEGNANKLHFICTDFNSSTHVTCRPMLSVIMCFIKILYSSLNTTLIVDKHCSDVCCNEVSVPHIDSKSKQVREQWDEKIYLQSVWGKTLHFKHRKYQTLWMNKKLEGIKCNLFAFSSISPEYMQKIRIFNFPR